MSEAVRVWLEVSYAAAHKVGGWGFVRAAGGELAGAAGGERRASLERIALAGLLAALKAPAGGRGVVVQTASPAVAQIPRRILEARAGKDAPTQDLELWAQATTALSAPGVRIVAGAAAAGAFAASWAELAREKAKGGAFAAAIPKSNLAKAGV